MALEFSTSQLADSLFLLRYYKNLGERAMAQVADDDLYYAPDEESNSIAIIVKHMAGNMRFPWTDFLTSDDENRTATATPARVVRSAARRAQLNEASTLPTATCC